MKKKLAYILCTVAGAGYFPFAPGTFTSLIAISLYYFTSPTQSTLIIGIILSGIITIAFTSDVESRDGKDPRHVVMDEVAGQWLTFLFIPNPSVMILVIGFVLFRFFDISKILGINRLQKMKGGWGVLVDDMLAGLYANILLQLLIVGKII